MMYMTCMYVMYTVVYFLYFDTHTHHTHDFLSSSLSSELDDTKVKPHIHTTSDVRWVCRRLIFARLFFPCSDAEESPAYW